MTDDDLIRARVALVDGVLTWLPRENNQWNACWAGKPVMGRISVEGYRHFAVNGRQFVHHRVVMFLRLGRWPGMVDHINGDRLDNRLENLRECDAGQNSCNARRSRTAASPYKGVRPQRGRFYARIYIDGVRHSLGGYPTAKAAALAYDKAAVRLHGAFASLNFPEEVAA